MLSFKLAVQNLKKGFKAFVPFLTSSITMFVLIFVTAAITFSPSIEKMRGATSVSMMMSLGMAILSIFGGVILAYSYRFLQLQRSKEFGLYDILGLGKKQVTLVAFFELLFTYLITVIIGSVIGVAFSKFLFLIFINMVGGTQFNLAINPTSILTVAGIYGVLFLILLCVGASIIWNVSSLDLLREASKGEKEPKSNLLFALIGLVFLGGGYVIALSVENPVKALPSFFLAVLAVIIGTYFFYVSVTVWYLKWRKKKNSYYEPHKFITISSMLYRMKANAVGLANITILLTMTLVTLVITIGLYIGGEHNVRQMFPREGMVETYDSNDPYKTQIALSQSIEEAAQKSNVKISDLSIEISDQAIVRIEKNSSSHLSIAEGQMDKKYENLILTTSDSLKGFGIKLSKLARNQVTLIDPSGKYKRISNITLFKKDYKIGQVIKKEVPIKGLSQLLIVFSNVQDLQQVLTNVESGDSPSIKAHFNISPKDEKAFSKNFKNKDAHLNFYTDVLAETRTGIASFVFIGFVLGISFILGAALIIYYKQLSEGVQDKRSFKILQEVGLSQEQVNKTIKTQVSTIFFLPIVMAIVHFGFAYVVIGKLLEMFGVTDNYLMLSISLLTILVILVLYWLIYKVTSRVYYNIVGKKNNKKIVL